MTKRSIKEVFIEVHLVLIENNKLLMLKRFNTGYNDGNYSLVAGHVEHNESAISAMIREAKEEADITLDNDDLELVHIIHRFENHERISFFFRAKKWQGQPKNMEPDKCSDLSWFALDNIPKNIVPYVGSALSHLKENIKYSELGWT